MPPPAVSSSNRQRALDIAPTSRRGIFGSGTLPAMLRPPAALRPPTTLRVVLRVGAALWAGIALQAGPERKCRDILFLPAGILRELRGLSLVLQAGVKNLLGL